MVGTNFFTGATPVIVALTDQNGNGFLVSGNTPSATSGYAIGCLMVDTVLGVLYINTGTATSATWTRVGSQ